MGKAFSTKALSPGTLLREWRLNEVLGVGGFGIVYLGRGIYFNDLVAIKEYFPSSISDRDDEDTVVPIDSEAEEVHALGLKKFIEEAKLLWNLSTPERHPNIVNVRSLFEIHGTAYMVMDFEDGNSLSRMLKESRRFDERSLLNIIKPIAEGLDRAHSVGALHRDIKPPNILINPDGRPVLIDFGSARVEVAGATKTSINFHTPPYAAIEQYVKTFPQGPWTDIYSLGVVLYECVVGEKPPEVLERLHGGLGQPLASGHWPGYSPRFLAAIDAAMVIRPEERPQSIRSWLTMFEPDAGGIDGPLAVQEIPEDACPGAVAREEMCGDVKIDGPQNARDGQFKSADKEPKKGHPASRAETRPPDKTVDNDPARKGTSVEPQKSSKSKFLIGAGAALLIGASIGGLAVFHGSSSNPVGARIATLRSPGSTPTNIGLLAEVAPLPSAARSLADDALAAGVPNAAVRRVADAAKGLGKLYDVARLDTGQASQSGMRSSSSRAMEQLAVTTFVQFANALLNNGEEEVRRLGSNPQTMSITKSLERLSVAVNQTAVAVNASSTLAGARISMAQWQNLKVAVAESYRQPAASKTAELRAIKSERLHKATAIPEVKTAKPRFPTAVSTTLSSVSSRDLRAKVEEIQSVVREGRSMARRVMGRGTRESAQLAGSYDHYLSSLKDSSRGIANVRQADLMLAQAKRTRAYLQYLVKQPDARN